jgi:hypothetical protein
LQGRLGRAAAEVAAEFQGYEAAIAEIRIEITGRSQCNADAEQERRGKRTFTRTRARRRKRDV